jgi:hypothetical protein
MKTAMIAILVLLIICVGGYVWYERSATSVDATNDQTSPPANVATTTGAQASASQTSIGKSVEGRDILAYHFGTGAKEVLFVGDIHGGYEWNTALVAQQLVEYLKSNPSSVPESETITVIPVLNPDGLFKVVGTTSPTFAAADVTASQTKQIAGRFNAKSVDLNRNFDCDWKTKGTWQSRSVSGGASAFSEPESQAIKQYIEAHTPAAVVVWYSSAGGVYSSSCDGTVLPATKTLTDLYANASGYPAHESFDAYETSGDMVNWLAKLQIPAISVLLTNHTDTEWSKNLAGVQAVIQSLAQ